MLLKKTVRLFAVVANWVIVSQRMCGIYLGSPLSPGSHCQFEYGLLLSLGRYCIRKSN